MKEINPRSINFGFEILNSTSLFFRYYIMQNYPYIGAMAQRIQPKILYVLL